ncbi:probable glucan 1,3-alpha-glucosidase [Anoplophora glabripennis]|uniref:probable glucan 1,3-alpha-glucosidase n=1 Tax=Anoplophora glabripennis TaxID=217634 RepID=UPI0008741E43|nr:probable glucan 1,3-alpha-glucosidase [Anoplophora glabripennis]
MLFFRLLFLVTSALAVDNNVFHDCSSEPFCATFRSQVLDANTQFVANVAEAQRTPLNTVNVPLTNGNGEELTLELSILCGHKMRIKVLEKVQKRFIIRYGIVLSKMDYPPTLEISNDTLTITTTWAVEDKIVVRKGPPFTVECYHQDQLEIVLNGDRLVMKNAETVEDQAFSFRVEFEGANKLYGLAHHSFQMALKETVDGSSEPFRMKNLDIGEYDEDSPLALYGSIPVVYGHSADFTSGVFLHNAAQMFVDINYTGDRPSAYFMVECGHFDLILFLGPTPRDVVRQYSSMMGVTRMPQLWVFGYHQNRHTYWTQEEVKDVVAKMDQADFPLDIIFLDYGYTNKYRYFEWNPENFTDPLEMQQNISATGRRIIAVSNTHVPVDLDYYIYVDGKELDIYVKNPEGSDYKDLTRAGESVWIDFLIPDALTWYAFLFDFSKFSGTSETIAGFCHDSNQPSFLNDTTERTFPPETLHYEQTQNREIHNFYPLMHVRAADAALSFRDRYEKRVFILSRAHFAGSHQYAAVWTGDNTASWPHLRNSITECLTYNLMGTVQCGANVGGFYGDPTEELLQRWYQVGIWIPYFRAHSSGDSAPREPYLFSEEVQSVIRLAIKTRYKHIPYWYRLMFDHTQSGDPLIRPLFYSYPEYIDYDDHFLIGEEILSRPVLEAGVSEVQVTFPGNDIWYRVDDDSWAVYEGGTNQNLVVNITTSPYFYRGGSIIPRMDIERPSTTQMMTDPFQLYVTLDDDDNAEGLLYFDDYITLHYIRASYFYFKLTYDYGTNGIRFQQVSGSSDGFTPRIQRIVVHRRGTNKETITTTYTTTGDGSPLEDVDIVQHLLLKEKEGFTIYL